MTVKDLDYENEFTKKLPQYIRQYQNFFKFMKLLSNYILKSCDYGKNILELLNLEKSEGDVLVKIAKKVDVTYERNYSDNVEEDLKKYYKNLKTGIYGVQTKRLSSGTLYELKDALIRLFPGIKEVDIVDNLDMSVNLIIRGDLEDVDSKTIENYIIPQVTGVKFNITYVPYGRNLFAFDKDTDISEENPYGEKGWDEGEWAPASTSN